MLDAAPHLFQRSEGTARVVLGPDGEVVDLYQKGSAKAMLPKVHSPVPEVVFLNTSGGLTGGDRLSLSLSVADSSTVMAATQTAERAYASSGDCAQVDVSIEIGEDAFCLWLPQETIAFDASNLNRKTTVTLGQGARFLGVETLVLGRQAMNETLSGIDLTDRRQIYDVTGTPLHAEHIYLSPNTLSRRTEKAGLADNTVFATLVYLAEDAEDRIDAVRHRLGYTCVASAWGNRLVVRADGDDSWTIRKHLIPIIEYLGIGRIPRVWQT